MTASRRQKASTYRKVRSERHCLARITQFWQTSDRFENQRSVGLHGVGAHPPAVAASRSARRSKHQNRPGESRLSHPQHPGTIAASRTRRETGPAATRPDSKERCTVIRSTDHPASSATCTTLPAPGSGAPVSASALVAAATAWCTGPSITATAPTRPTRTTLPSTSPVRSFGRKDRAVRGPSFPLACYSEPPAPDDAAPDFAPSLSRCDGVAAAGVDVAPWRGLSLTPGFGPVCAVAP